MFGQNVKGNRIIGDEHYFRMDVSFVVFVVKVSNEHNATAIQRRAVGMVVGMSSFRYIPVAVLTVMLVRMVVVKSSYLRCDCRLRSAFMLCAARNEKTSAALLRPMEKSVD